MKIYEDKDKKDPYRSAPRCGYCRHEGHNQYNCPEVAKDWAWWKNHQVPVTPSRYYGGRSTPKYWGEWYQKCKELYEEQQRRALAPKAKRPKANTKCGFCGEHGHNRRNCKEMGTFKQDCYKANENWRRAAYKELVEKHGICVGACVEVQKPAGWRSTDKKPTVEVAIITEVNFDSLNLMAAKKCYYNGYVDPYECQLKIKALINGQEEWIRMDTTDNHYKPDDFAYGLPKLSKVIFAKQSFTNWGSWYVSKLLSPSEHPLDENWVTGYKDAFNLMLKKRSLEQLDSDGVTSLIFKWLKKV